MALFHALVSNWANDLRKEVTGLQDDVLQKLDELQERMSKYEENIDEDRIMAFASEAASLLSGNNDDAAGDTLQRVRGSLTNLDRGTSLTEVLTLLLDELASFAPRVALFILKGGSCIGWNGRGFDESQGFSNEGIKKISVPTNADTLFATVIDSRSTFVGDSNRQGDNIQLLSRIGNVLPTTVFATPLILRDRIAAVVYADSGDSPEELRGAAALEILTAYAAKLLDALSVHRTGRTGEHAAAAGPSPRPTAPPTPTPTPVAPPPTPQPAAVVTPQPEEEEESGTVMFDASEMSVPSLESKSGSGPPSSPGETSQGAAAPAPDLDALDPETRKKHEEAMRFARLLVSEIKLYNESKVQQGRANRGLYELLRDDIERSRQLYKERVSEGIRSETNYFNDELVRILAEGDEGAMGQPLPSA